MLVYFLSIAPSNSEEAQSSSDIGTASLTSEQPSFSITTKEVDVQLSSEYDTESDIEEEKSDKSDIEREVEQDVDPEDTYNLDYMNDCTSAYYDCYKIRINEGSIFQRKHILLLCSIVGEYLFEKKELLIDQIVQDLRAHSSNLSVAHIISYLENDDRKKKQAAKDIIKNLKAGIQRKECAFRKMKFEGSQMMKGIPHGSIRSLVHDRFVRDLRKDVKTKVKGGKK